MSDELTAGPVAELDGLTKQVNAEEPADATPEVGEEADPQATANEGDNPNETPEQHKRLGGWQRAKLKAEREAAQANRERDFWRDEALRKRDEPAKVETVANQPKRPKLEEFKTVEEYEDALTEYITTRATEKAQEKVLGAVKQQTAQQKSVERWQEQQAKIAEKHVDYPDVAQMAVKTMQQHQGDSMTAVASAIRANDAGTEMLYYLGQHPEEVARLSRLDPYSAVMELGALKKVIAKEDPAKVEDKTPTSAQSQAATKYPPPQDKGRASGADPNALRDDLPMAEWEKRFAARLAAHKG